MSAQAHLTVAPLPLGITLTPSTTIVAPGGDISFTAVVLGCDGQPIPNVFVNLTQSRNVLHITGSTGPVATLASGTAFFAGAINANATPGPAAITAALTNGPTGMNGLPLVSCTESITIQSGDGGAP